jgi:hypothetical protein
MMAQQRAGRCVLLALAVQTGCLAQSSTSQTTQEPAPSESAHPPSDVPVIERSVTLPVEGSDRLVEACNLSFQVDEELTIEVPVVTLCEAENLRSFVGALPPGATWDAHEQLIRFTPDAFQGGSSHTVALEFRASDGRLVGHGEVQIQVRNTVTHPEWTRISTRERLNGRVHLFQQRVNEHLANPETDASEFIVEVGVPEGAIEAQSMPLRVYLHGFNGEATVEPVAHEFRMAVADPHNTYWYGELGPDGRPHPYSERRVLHAIEQALGEYPGIDRDRVYLVGPSMGGAGAATIGLVHNRHFSWVYATIGQAIPRNHRAVRLAQLSGIWGSPGSYPDIENPQEPWDSRDLTWVAEHVPGAVSQFMVLKHGKDDAIIHFGAMLEDSPLTGRSFYETMASLHMPGMVAWDEGGHGTPDPRLEDEWWMDAWDPASGQPSILRNAPALAAAGNSCDEQPGSRAGDGSREWDPNAGFAGNVDVPSDSGWGGDSAGARNRGVRWQTEADTVERLQLSVWTSHPDCSAAAVSLTVHRAQWFRLAAGEQVTWAMGELRGMATADGFGLLTIEGVTITQTPTTLLLERVWR